MRPFKTRYLVSGSVVLLLAGLIAFLLINRQLSRGDQSESGTLWPGTGPWAENFLERMTLEQKIAQMLIHWPDTSAWNGGGLVLATGSRLDTSVTRNPSGVLQPMLVYGRAGSERLRPLEMPGAALMASNDTLLAYSWGRLIGRQAYEAGAHMVMIPASLGGITSDCLLGADALPAPLVRYVVQGAQTVGVLAGISPVACAADTSSQVQPDSLRLASVAEAIQAGVMAAETPDSLLVGPSFALGLRRRSTLLGARNLRRSLGFQGLTLTQLTETQPDAQLDDALDAIEGGVDLIVVRHNAPALYRRLLQAVESGEVSERRIDASVQRILEAKKWLGLVGGEQQVYTPNGPPLANELRLVQRTLAASSLTLLKNTDGAFPLPGTRRRLLVVQVSDGNDAEERRIFADEMRRERIGVSLAFQSVSINSDELRLGKLLAQARRYDAVLVTSFVSEDSTRLPRAFRSFADSLLALPGPAIVLSFANTSIISHLSAAEAVLVAWDERPVTLGIVAEALFGRIPVDGRLPFRSSTVFAPGTGIRTAQVAPRRGIPEDMGMDSRSLDRIDSLITAAIAERAFPGAAVVIGRGGTIVKMRGYGRFAYNWEQRVTTRSRFDLASLTKVVATTVAAMKLFEQGKLNLDAPASSYLPTFKGGGKERVTVRQLLSHSSGMPATLVRNPDLLSREQVIDAILAESLAYQPGSEFLYSDEGMIILGLIIERITGQDLATFTRERLFTPMRMYDTGFRPVGGPDSTFVPTEVDSTFRKRLVQGEVHDEIAYLLGGTAGNAGLFSTAEDMAKFCYTLLNGGQIYARQILKPETIQLFTTRVDPTGKSTRTLGWDTRSTDGYSSAGTLFGPRSFGHTGFTGTSLWIDPDAELFVVLLSNRIYPTRENDRHAEVRARLADLAYKAIMGPARPLLPANMPERSYPVRM